MNRSARAKKAKATEAIVTTGEEQEQQSLAQELEERRGEQKEALRVRLREKRDQKTESPKK